MQPISWDIGTAYDLFGSLYILHHPAMFGLRPAWAAGVRSRLPSAQRDFLQWAYTFITVPLAWLNQIQVIPKDASAGLAALTELDPAERLPSLSFSAEITPETAPILGEIRSTGKWQASQLEALRSIYMRHRIAQWPEVFQNLCDAWTRPAEFGERLLAALRTYCQVFYFEEEERIAPVLQESLQTAQSLAGDMPGGRLVERLSKGVQLDLVASSVVLVPSFWAGPLVFVNKLASDRYILMFGGRGETRAWSRAKRSRNRSWQRSRLWRIRPA